jgi:hypothetical protein
MSQLFGRRARISIGTITVGDETSGPNIGGAEIPVSVRMAFKITKDRKAEPNKCEVQIYNLSPDSRAGIQKGQLLTVEAGYAGTVAQIFQGDIRTISHVHNSGDWITKLTAGDGETAHRSARCVDSFGPKTKVSAVLQRLIDAYGLKAGNAISVVKEKARIQEYLQGKTLSGRASEQLERVLADVGLEYSIQDGALQVVEIGKAVDAPAILLGPDSGLIGSPELAEEGKDKKTVIKFKSLLQPKIIPARLVDLDSATKKGVVRVDKLTHNGDTFANAPYYTECEGSLL